MRFVFALCVLAGLAHSVPAQRDTAHAVPTRHAIFTRSLTGAAIGAAIGGLVGPSNINTICERPGSGCDASRWIANGGGFGFFLGGAIGAASGAHSADVGLPGLLANLGLALVAGLPSTQIAAGTHATPLIALTPIAQAAAVAWRTDRALGDRRRMTGAPIPNLPPLHDGFWLTVGGGPGYANVGCTSCDAFTENDPWRGGSAGAGIVAMGGTLANGRLVGGELNSWSKGRDVAAEEILILAVLQTYTGSSPFYTKVGAGLGSIDMQRGQPEQRIDAIGPALLVGVGYDIRVGRTVALSPYASYGLMLPIARRQTNTTNGVSGGLSGNIQFGASLAWY